MCIGRAQNLRLHARGQNTSSISGGGGDSQKLGGFLTSEDGGGAVRFFPRRCYNSSNSIRIVRTPILNSSGGTMKTDGLTVLGHVHSTSQNPTATCMCACERART